MLRYKGGTIVANIQVQGTGTRLMFKVRTLGKNPPGAKGVKTQRQSATGLRIRHALDGLVESNMESELDQRNRYANVINTTHNGNFLQCEFNETK
jgi:hypothetical protein